MRMHYPVIELPTIKCALMVLFRLDLFINRDSLLIKLFDVIVPIRTQTLECHKIPYKSVKFIIMR